jgi:predicted nucleic acid-binding protein
MNGDSIVADTSLLINLFNGVAAARKFIEDRTIFVSVIKEIEVLSYTGLSANDKRLIKSFLSECLIIDLEAEIKELTIEIRSKFKTKLPDAVIAATAIRYDLPLFTMDKNFKKVTNLKSVILEI